ncbi:hypothetical protein HN51_058260 [Arachis hypogaea]
MLPMPSTCPPYTKTPLGSAPRRRGMPHMPSHSCHAKTRSKHPQTHSYTPCNTPNFMYTIHTSSQVKPSSRNIPRGVLHVQASCPRGRGTSPTSLTPATHVARHLPHVARWAKP